MNRGLKAPSGKWTEENITVFLNEWIATGNRVESAFVAKIYPRAANRKTVREYLCKYLDEHPEIEEQKQELLDQIARENSSIASRDEVLETLTKLMRNDTTEEVVVTVGTGKGFSEVKKVDKDMSGLTRAKAAELLGRAYGLYNDKLQVEGKIPVVICDDLSD